MVWYKRQKILKSHFRGDSKFCGVYISHMVVRCKYNNNNNTIEIDPLEYTVNLKEVNRGDDFDL